MIIKQRKIQKKRWHLENGMANFNEIFYNYKASANKKGFIFEISKEQFKEITKKDCHYCGEKPSKISYMRKRCLNYGYYIYNGLDRIDSNIGYKLENIVPCCQKCNFMKLRMTQEDFLEHIEKIYKFNNK